LVKEITECRSCKSTRLHPILSLGEQALSDFVDNPNASRPLVPLELVLCQDCYLLQLKHTAPRDDLYRKYWYYSGVNQTMRDALRDITKAIEDRFGLTRGDYVIDIGSNDSTLLKSYSVKGIKKIGFEPSNIALEAQLSENEGVIVNNYFNYPAVQYWLKDKKAKAITAIAMFYDLDEPNVFLQDVKKSLSPDGVFVIQMSYTPTMFEQLAFDNICHEHLEYYTLTSLLPLLERNDLKAFDVEFNDVNGGSFRIWISHKNSKYQISTSIAKTLEEEERNGYKSLEIYKEFAQRVEGLRENLQDLIKSLVGDGYIIYGYGASTKGNTTLQYCRFTSNEIKKIADRNPRKWGKYTVKSAIPIISEEEMRKDKPDYLLILPWAFLPEFLKRERDYLLGGGKFIIPVPEVKIIGAEGGS